MIPTIQDCQTRRNSPHHTGSPTPCHGEIQAHRSNRGEATPGNPTRVIELAKGICVRTALPTAHHSALRSGFAGYPVNPRWTVPKVMAWKHGKQWREALAAGKMVVRPQDSLLMTLEESAQEPRPKSQGPFCFLPHWPRRSP